MSLLATSVTVGSIPANLSAGTWVAENVPLREGGNSLTVVARSAAGGVGSATARVVRDTEAPRVVIQSPPDGSISSSAQVFVSGEIIDPAWSDIAHPPLSVTVNGQHATVDFRSFVLPEQLLHPGENRIEVEAADTAGNVGRSAVTVTYLADAPVHIEPLSGNFQEAEVRQTLASPLVVRFADAFGRSLPGRSVEFRVSRGDGSVVSHPDRGRKVSVLTDDNGLAEVRFELGSRAGAGNHEVTVTTLGIPGAVVFCASARAAKAKWIEPIVGNDFSGERTGTAGQPFPRPLLIQVFDERGNPVPGVETTFDAIAGGGSFDGLPEVRRVTDREGKASAVYTLGSGEGVNNNVVAATFAENESPPAVFTISGLVPGPPELTSASGILLDPEDAPIPGARIHVGTLETRTEADGRFHLAGVPVGTIHLDIDGSTVARPGTWPNLGYELVTVAGRDNGVGKPLRLPPIDSAGKRRVGGDQDVTIPIHGVAGATLKVFAHSVTFPDGSHEGDVAFTQVPAQKVPMVAPMNAGFMLAWTIQPAGVRFDPPAQVSIPNFGAPGGGGNPPGLTGEIFSFDHDLGEFVSAGTASITEDGRMMTSNPGMGITKAGWGGCPHPPAPPAIACGKGTCNDCNGNQPVAKVKLGPVAATARGSEQGAVVKKDQPLLLSLRTSVRPACTLDVTWTFGDGEMLKGEVVAHAFKMPGTYTVTVAAQCSECGDPPQMDTIEVGVVDLKPSELTFKGAGFHVVRQDTGAGAYPAPHWKDMSSPADGDSEDMGDHRYPVIYKRGSVLVVNLKVAAKATLNADLLAGVRIRGMAGLGIRFPAKEVSAAGESIAVTDETSEGSLPNQIDRLDPFEIIWEISFDSGATWDALGATAHRIYVTLDDPDVPSTSTYESIVDISCRNAKGKTDAMAALDAIWSDFKSLRVTRKERDGTNRPDGGAMFYWVNDGDPLQLKISDQCRHATAMINPMAEEDLRSIGNCSAWAELLAGTLQVQGVKTTKKIEVVVDQRINSQAIGFLVHNIHFSSFVAPGDNMRCETTAVAGDRQGPGGDGGPLKTCVAPGRDGLLQTTMLGGDDRLAAEQIGPLNEVYVENLDGRPSTIGLLGTIFDDSGVPGQGPRMNPPFIFNNHFILWVADPQGVTRYYDPSYGIGPYSTTQEHENAAFAAIFAKPRFPKPDDSTESVLLAKAKDPTQRECCYFPTGCTPLEACCIQ